MIKAQLCSVFYHVKALSRFPVKHFCQLNSRKYPKTKPYRALSLSYAAAWVLSLSFLIGIGPGPKYALGQSQPLRASISGHVFDTHGDVVGDAKVTLKPLPDGVLLTTRTNDKGAFVFSNLPVGRYRLSVTKQGFAAITNEVSLSEQEMRTLTLSLNPERIRDSVTVMPEDGVEGPQGEFNGRAQMSEVEGVTIYAGKKTDVLVLGNLNANLALGTTRQVFGKVPGTNIWENDGAGLQIGVSSRGLDPNRSWEMNSRQNGYDITADIFGYPEAYFTPPLEAVERIDVVRGSASLQFGAQFGGLVNYILKEAPPDRRFTFTTEQTGGANGLFNSHNRMGGRVGKLAYNGYYQHRRASGWRENSGFDANTGFGSLNYYVNDKLDIKLELTAMGYLLQMAGGLTDELFKQDPRISIRNGNWFNLKWFVPALKINYELDSSTKLSLSVFGLRGTRYSLFNSQSPAFPNGELNPDNPNAPRTFFNDRFHNHGLEFRLLKQYRWLGSNNALAAGFRYSNGKTLRQHGLGFPGEEPIFDWLVPEVDRNLHFRNVNFAGFAENIFRLTEKLSVTPGVRFDYIDSSGTGRPIVGTMKRIRTIPMFGLGVTYNVVGDMTLYGNISQAYRATLFNDFWRPDPTIIVDQNLDDMTGYVTEFGARGRHSRWLYYDVGGFYVKYRNRLGLLTRPNEQAQTVSFWTNISDSRNIGLEGFVEADLTRMFGVDDSKGSLSLFSSIAQIDTRYLEGSVRDNRVEFAPESIIRTGLTYRIAGFNSTLQYSRVGDQFTDASNTLFTVDAVQGLIPSYQVWDLSGSYRLKKYYVLRGGVNNIANRYYFTRRGTSYPGPGLIPADGRSFYVGVGINY